HRFFCFAFGGGLNVKVSPKFIMLAVALLAFAPLYYYDATPQYIAQIKVEATAAINSKEFQGFVPISSDIMTKVSDDGPGFFQIVVQSQQSRSEDELSHPLFLEISPQEE